MEGLRLLVIDDSEEDYQTAVHVLRDLYEVARLRVDNAEHLTSALQAHDWDLCLLDWVLPEITTPEVMRIIAASRQAKVPCIVWSGKDDPKVRFIAEEVLGARRFVAKADYDKLPLLVREVLEEERRR